MKRKEMMQADAEKRRARELAMAALARAEEEMRRREEEWRLRKECVNE